MDGKPRHRLPRRARDRATPALLTRRGAEVLARAEVVVYDHLASASSA